MKELLKNPNFQMAAVAIGSFFLVRHFMKKGQEQHSNAIAQGNFYKCYSTSGCQTSCENVGGTFDQSQNGCWAGHNPYGKATRLRNASSSFDSSETVSNACGCGA